MSLENIMQIAASGMSAQTVRLNVAASNLANANTTSGTKEAVYHAKEPVFATILDGERAAGGVRVSGINQSNLPVQSRYEPGNSQADKNGYVYTPNVVREDELANVMSASTDYKMNVDLMNTSKTLMMKTINLLDR